MAHLHRVEAQMAALARKLDEERRKETDRRKRMLLEGDLLMLDRLMAAQRRIYGGC